MEKRGFSFVIGQSQFLTTPLTAKPLSFSLALDDQSHQHEYEHEPPVSAYTSLGYRGEDDESTTTARIEDSDARLMEMLAAQAAHREVDSLAADEDSIAVDEKLTDDEKKDILQRSLNMAASNGDVARVQKLLEGKAKEYVDVNMPDEEGTVPLIYASCFVRNLPTPLPRGNCAWEEAARRFGRLGKCADRMAASNFEPGPSRCRICSSRFRGSRRQTGSQPVERAYVGNDEPA